MLALPLIPHSSEEALQGSDAEHKGHRFRSHPSRSSSLQNYFSRIQTCEEKLGISRPFFFFFLG